MKSQLPEGGKNLFQEIKKMTAVEQVRQRIRHGKFLQFILSLFALGNVAEDAHENVAVVYPNMGRPDFYRYQLSALGQKPVFQRQAGIPSLVLPEGP